MTRTDTVAKHDSANGIPAVGSPHLVADEQGRLALDADGMQLCGDFERMLPRLRQDRLARELLVKAARVRGIADSPLVVDATAGLGEDSLLLAAAGFNVVLIERDPLVAALLGDACKRATKTPELAEAVSRMHLLEGNSVELLPRIEELVGRRPDVVYLDPMFPARHKDAATKKKLQMLRKLEQPATEEEGAQLLQAALEAHPRRVVVKRPLKGPFLAGVKPSHSLRGKVVRYDCIACG